MLWARCWIGATWPIPIGPQPANEPALLRLYSIRPKPFPSSFPIANRRESNRCATDRAGCNDPPEFRRVAVPAARDSDAAWEYLGHVDSQRAECELANQRWIWEGG